MRAADSSALVKYLSREPNWESAREAILEGVVALFYCC
jgi:predicted nucleic acid-binding protein